MAALLRQAADQFSNHGCNDFDVREIRPKVTVANISDLWQKLSVDNDPELAERNSPLFQDWMLMRLFANMMQKEADTPREPQAKRQALVAQEKHGTRVFDATTETALHKSALALVAERLKIGWYYEPEEPKKPELTKEQVEALPEGKIRKEAKRQHRDYRQELEEHEEDVEFWQNVQTALETQDGALAWKCLQHRDDHEYEQVYLTTLEG